MHPGRLIALGAALAALGGAATDAGAGHAEHEFWLGLGGGAAFEKSIFNVPQDLESKPELVVSLGYMNNLNARQAVGLHLYGGNETTPEVMLVSASGDTHLTRFELNAYHLGARYRHTLVRGVVSPYVIVGLSWASGSIESGPTGELTYGGFSACAGPGAAVALGRRFMLAAEAVGTLGAASWKQQPFANSTGRAFNPSLATGTVSLSYLWGLRD